MNKKGFTFIRMLPYIIFTLTVVVVGFVGYSMYVDYKEQNVQNEDISLSLGTTSGMMYIDDDRTEISIIGKNYGVLSCSSDDNTIASCGINGDILVVKPGTKAGKATITVKESAGNNVVKYEITILSKNTSTTDKVETKPSTTVSSSLSLSYSYGTIYVGKTATLIIKGSNYGTLSCSSSNTNVATCTISGTKLLITPKTVGTATITVKGTSGKTASYKATVAKSSTTSSTTSTSTSSFSLSSTTGVTSVDGSALTTTIKGSNYGTIECATSNRNVAICGVNGNEIKITPQSKSGTVTITVVESKNNKTATYTVTVLPKGVTKVPTLTLSSTSGTTKGDILTATVSGENYGTLSCSSSNSKIASCKINNNLLSVIPVSNGEATITVKEKSVGIAVTYKVTVKYDYECTEGTLTEDNTYGTICITPSDVVDVTTCSKYDTSKVDKDITSAEDSSFENDNYKLVCRLNSNSTADYDKYLCDLTTKECLDYTSKTEYSCLKGWSIYSGSGVTLKCYKSASLKK